MWKMGSKNSNRDNKLYILVFKLNWTSCPMSPINIPNPSAKWHSSDCYSTLGLEINQFIVVPAYKLTSKCSDMIMSGYYLEYKYIQEWLTPTVSVCHLITQTSSQALDQPTTKSNGFGCKKRSSTPESIKCVDKLYGCSSSPSLAISYYYRNCCASGKSFMVRRSD